MEGCLAKGPYIWKQNEEGLEVGLFKAFLIFPGVKAEYAIEP